jgi:RimJ/RimL family protein N-acetyltransferase
VIESVEGAEERMGTIETPRLVLRPPRKDDLDRMVALGADPEVMRYIGDGNTQTREEAVKWLEGILREAREGTSGLPGWLVAATREGDWVGLAVLKPMNPRHEEAIGEGQLVEVGYRLARAHWGRGYATEAAAALVRHGFVARELPAVTAIADARNVASNRVIEKVGLVRRKTYSLNGRTILYHRLDRADYPSGERTERLPEPRRGGST